MRISFIFIALLFLGCANTVSKDQLAKINGYWEIEKVVMPDGIEKEYSMNPIIDYFMFDDMKGYRKKVQPLFDGTFDTSDDAQPFEVKQSENAFLLHYTNELSEWTETITSLNETSLILLNEDGTKYYYKKFESLNLDLE